ncbi:MAG: GHKL domain-containing protein [Desulfobacterales bacterium]|nr:MAG: GHKL domain-containing protein [Desulfobacterales bacterium]
MNKANLSRFHDLTFKSVLDALPCYLTIQDADLNILFVNQTFVEDFGNGVGRPCYKVFQGNEHKCRECPVQKTFIDKKVHIAEETILLGDGTVNQMIVYSAPLLDLVGNVSAVIKILTNVNMIKDVQKELVTLGQSFAVLTHDLKNMLEGLEGGAYVVNEGIKDKDWELTGKGWHIVGKNITEISRVTQNILYSSKKRTPQFQKVKPHEIARRTVELFQEKASVLKVQLMSQLNPTLPSTTLDSSSITRMLSNLIWNALEACEKDNRKAYNSVFVRADYYNKDHYMFEVEDNAAGMDEVTEENLFKEFYSTKGDNGTGLGLMVVDRIVRNHNGKIEVLTRSGIGSLFRTIFPI